jgi:hypothetical protein
VENVGSPPPAPQAPRIASGVTVGSDSATSPLPLTNRPTAPAGLGAHPSRTACHWCGRRGYLPWNDGDGRVWWCKACLGWMAFWRFGLILSPGETTARYQHRRLFDADRNR